MYLFKSGFVVIWVLCHQRLDGDEDRGDTLGWTPCWACPCPTNRDTHRSTNCFPSQPFAKTHWKNWNQTFITRCLQKVILQDSKQMLHESACSVNKKKRKAKIIIIIIIKNWISSMSEKSETDLYNGWNQSMVGLVEEFWYLWLDNLAGAQLSQLSCWLQKRLRTPTECHPLIWYNSLLKDVAIFLIELFILRLKKQTPTYPRILRQTLPLR